MKKRNVKLAALTFKLNQQDNRIQLLPAGRFRATDGRPFECPEGWLLNTEIANAVITKAAAKQNRFVIDYEHQTLHALKNGQPAPAAGWFAGLEWQSDVGLFGAGVEWTEKARAMIVGDEYRFISAVFLYNSDGHIIEILHAALTNTPAIDGMDEVFLAAASQFTTQPHPQEEPSMDELLEQLRWMLNLPLSATAEEIIAELMKLKERITGTNNTDNTAAANLFAYIDMQNQKIAALSAQTNLTPDPAKFVPVDVMQQIQAQLAALSAESSERKVNDLVTAALSDSRLLPAQEKWARDLGASNFEALRSYLESAPKIAALTSQQSKGVDVKTPGNTTVHLNETALAVCNQLGITPEQFVATQNMEVQ